MKSTILAAAMAAFLVAPATYAQDAAPAPAAIAIAQTPTQNAMLRAGTPVVLRMMEEITTKKKAARVGQRFMMEVAEPVVVNNVTVIPSGTPAWGEITNVRNKGMWGKSGKLDARVLYLRANGRQIRLTGTFDDKGVTGTGGVVASVALVPLAGFFVTGTSAVLPKGGTVGGFIDEDVELAFANAAPAPLTVPAPAPAMTVPEAPASATPTTSVDSSAPAG
ncbi:MAG: hypothetical protein ACO1NN_07650 [Sphingopyxis sp.]